MVGRSKTQIQFYMIHSVQNLKRLLGYFSQQFSEILSVLTALEVIKIKFLLQANLLLQNLSKIKIKIRNSSIQ